MNVAPQFRKISTLLDQERFETPLKKMTALSVPPVEIHGHAAQQPLHPAREICLTGAGQEMKMVRHQHPRVQLDIEALQGLDHPLLKTAVVFVLPEDRLPTIPSCRHV